MLRELNTSRQPVDTSCEEMRRGRGVFCAIHLDAGKHFGCTGLHRAVGQRAPNDEGIIGLAARDERVNLSKCKSVVDVGVVSRQHKEIESAIIRDQYPAPSRSARSGTLTDANSSGHRGSLSDRWEWPSI